MCWAWSGMWRALVAWCLRQSCKRMEKGGEQQAPCSGLPLSPPPASRRVSRAGGGLRQPRGAPGGSPASGFSSPHHDGQSSGPPSAPGTCLRAHGACACLGKPPGAMEERKRSLRVVSVGYFVIKQHKWSGRPPHDARCRRRPSRTSPHNARGASAVGGCANGRRASVPGARAAPPGAQRACRISNAAAWHVCRAASPAVNDCICEPNKQRIRRALAGMASSPPPAAGCRILLSTAAAGQARHARHALCSPGPLHCREPAVQQQTATPIVMK